MIRAFSRALQLSMILVFICVPVALAAVRWTHTDNVSVSGATIKKTSGCDGCYDAFAEAGQRVGATGYAEFAIGDPAPLLIAGLARDFTPGDGTSIDFGIRVQDGIAEVREGGAYRTDIVAEPGSVFRISISRGGVSYFKNGSVFYTAPASKRGLSFDVLFADRGASISDTRISNGQ